MTGTECTHNSALHFYFLAIKIESLKWHILTIHKVIYVHHFLYMCVNAYNMYIQSINHSMTVLLYFSNNLFRCFVTPILFISLICCCTWLDLLIFMFITLSYYYNKALFISIFYIFQQNQTSCHTLSFSIFSFNYLILLLIFNIPCIIYIPYKCII